MIRTGAYQHHWIPHSDHHVHFNSNDHHHNLHHNNYKHNNHDHGDRCWPERPAPLLLQTANHLQRIGPEQIIEDSVNGDSGDIGDSDDDDDDPPAENCKHPGPEPCTGEAQPSVTEEAQIWRKSI